LFNARVDERERRVEIVSIVMLMLEAYPGPPDSHLWFKLARLEGRYRE
jgi:hypothetical protein